MATHLPSVESLFDTDDDDDSGMSDDGAQRDVAARNTNDAFCDATDRNALMLPAGPAGQPLPVQLDGYVPPEGAPAHTQPRAPFARTSWNGFKNAFERIYITDTKRTGVDPAGCVW